MVTNMKEIEKLKLENSKLMKENESLKKEKKEHTKEVWGVGISVYLCTLLIVVLLSKF